MLSGRAKGQSTAFAGMIPVQMGRHGRWPPRFPLLGWPPHFAVRMDLATPTRPNSREATAPGILAAALASPSVDLRLAGTAALAAISPSDPRLTALRQACALLETLEAEGRALDQRLAAARRIDPMRQASGQTSLETAMEETRALIRQLDDLLCEAAESARSTGITHPKDQK